MWIARGRAVRKWTAYHWRGCASANQDPLFRPFKLKHLTFKNRILSTSHAPAYVENGMPARRYQLYHEEKAKGGLALTMFGGSSTVSVDSPAAFGQINVSHDRVIPYFREFAQRIHSHDCHLMCQLTHMGFRTMWDVADWTPVVAPSRIREPSHKSFPKSMELADISRVVRDFASAARRCQEGGLDGVELLAGGHLVDQFWSPLSNHRTDEYGGNLENRMRFGCEVLRAMREATDPDFVIGIRMVVGEVDGHWETEGGLTQDDGMEIAKRLVEAGLVDFLNINYGFTSSDRGLSKLIPGMRTDRPLAPYVDIAGRFKEALPDVPVFHACRVSDSASARRAIRDRQVDMIGMTRAHIADPHLVSKIRRGEEEQIRPCVGAGYCLDRIYVGQDALCLHNAATGREALGMVHAFEPAPQRRKVVVVGGGVAGLEACRVAALRGHAVLLLEATGELGGQVNLASRATWRRDLVGIPRWLASEVERLGVEVRYHTLAGAEEVMAEAPDVVCIATGGLPDDLGFAEAVSPWDLLSGAVPAGKNILVYDGVGGYTGPSVAEFAGKQQQERGDTVQIELATQERNVALAAGALNFPVFMENLYKLGVQITPDHRLVAVESCTEPSKRATLRNVFTNASLERNVDQVVVEHGTVPCDDLYHDLVSLSKNQGEVHWEHVHDASQLFPTRNLRGEFILFRVGDAISSRNIHAAIYDSLRLVKDL
mmetsp:Transcript_28805/g.82486  ORF Transcript_28805/g.82486 Transcript_28805/m.82486 type:complete len:713 (-) Transcript_28805:279-2417(-)